MRILISGYHNPHFVTITEYLEEAVAQCGHEVLPFDNRRFLIPGRLRSRAPWLQQLDLARINRRLVELAAESRPALFVETGGHRILPASVDRLRELGVTTVLWTIDPPLDFEPVVAAAPHYDLVVCGGTEAIELLEQRGIHGATWLPFGCAPEHHFPPELSDEDRRCYGNDVVFVGSRYPNRERLLECLGDLDLGVWGPGWDRLGSAHPLRSRVRGNQLTPDQWTRIYAASKIVVVIHYQDGRIPCYQGSPKVYETLACGSFALVDDQRDVFELFEDGVHLARFRDGNELQQRVADYLGNPAARSRIARDGRAEVLERHTYRHRVTELVRRAAR
jgi:spore maturation protein CgeB